MSDFAVSRNTRIVGGLFGIVAAVAVIPAYLAGSPEAPSTPADAAAYYEQASSFVLLNGVIPLVHIIAFLLFLAVLATLIGQAGGTAFAARAAVLAGGIGLVTLTAAGFAAEIAFPATAARFPDAELDPGLPLVLLTFAVWLYHFAQAAGAVMILGVAIVALRTAVFPSWFGWLSIPFAIVGALHTWLGVWSAWITLGWLVLASLVVMVGRERPLAGATAR